MSPVLKYRMKRISSRDVLEHKVASCDVFLQGHEGEERRLKILKKKPFRVKPDYIFEENWP